MNDYPIDAIRAEFPQLSREIRGKRLVYLDTAATALKPRCVIDRLTRFYEEEYGTVRRGIYLLSQEATALYEGVRAQAARYLNASEASEVVFVRGVTEGINLVAHGFARSVLRPGDEVLITEMEHHANIVSWQLACEQSGARLKVAPIDDRGDVILEAWEALLTDRVRIAAFVHVSNALGTLNPARQMIAMARDAGAAVLLDGAQSAPHEVVDVRMLGCDFFVCSAHKMYGPTGVGVLWGRQSWLARLPPWQGGGEMIRTVTFEGSTYEDPPYRFEAGTPAFAQAIGFGAALSWIEGHGRTRLARWENALAREAEARLLEVPGLRLIGTAREKGPIVAFVVEGLHPFDIGTILDQQGIAVRAGHHCAQPVMQRYGVPATVRASFGPYSTPSDVDALVEGVRVAQSLLS